MLIWILWSHAFKLCERLTMVKTTDLILQWHACMHGDYPIFDFVPGIIAQATIRNTIVIHKLVTLCVYLKRHTVIIVCVCVCVCVPVCACVCVRACTRDPKGCWRDSGYFGNGVYLQETKNRKEATLTILQPTDSINTGWLPWLQTGWRDSGYVLYILLIT